MKNRSEKILTNIKTRLDFNDDDFIWNDDEIIIEDDIEIIVDDEEIIDD